MTRLARRALLALPAFPAFLVVGCDGDFTAPPPEAPPAATAIIDAAHEDAIADGFYFLPPMVGQPAYAGTFNPLAHPRVVICSTDAVADPRDCADPGGADRVAEFTRGGGSGGAAIVVLPDDELFQVDWHTDAFDVDTAAEYRIHVYLTEHPGAQELGWADVKFGANGAALKNVDTGETVALVDGRTLPIKFRIETGAGCEGELDCGSGTVGPGGGTVTTANGAAGVTIDADVLNEEITIEIRQLDPAGQPGGHCLPTGIRQDGACYDFTVVDHEDGYDFGAYVTVGICPSPNALREERLALHKYNPARYAEDGVVELESTSETFLRCDALTGPGYVQAPTSLFGRLAGLARRALGPVAAVLSPAELQARDVGRAGLTDSFTRFSWAEPVVLSAAGVPGAAAPGETVTGTVMAETAHNHDESGEPTAPVPGSDAGLRFDYQPPAGGTPSHWYATTDAQGAIPLSWELEATPGTHTLVISSRDVDGSLPGSPLIDDPTAHVTLYVEVCGGELGCGAGVIGPEGGRIMASDGTAFVELPPGAVDGPITIIMRELDPAQQPGAQCLPTGLRQDGTCWEFNTLEEIADVQEGGADTFHEPATVGFCPDADAVRPERLTIHKYDPERFGDGVVELEATTESVLTCPGDVEVIGSRDGSFLGRLGSLARRALAPVAAVLAPAPLQARDVGRAGLTDSFSRFAWAESVTLGAAGFPTSAEAGATVAGTITALTAHNQDEDHAPIDPVAATDARLRFEYRDPDGLQDVWFATTDGAGEVAVSLPLTGAAGEHTLTVSSRATDPSLDGDPVIPDPTNVLTVPLDVAEVACVPALVAVAPTLATLQSVPEQEDYGSTTLVATAYDLNQQACPVELAWSSASPEAVSVDETGTVTGLVTGVAVEITATVLPEGPSGTATVVVTAPGAGAFIGYVRTTGGEPLPGAEVDLLQNGDPVATAITDAAGRVFFPALQPGAYDVEVSLVGYLPVYDGTPTATIEDGSTWVAELVLAPAEG